MPGAKARFLQSGAAVRIIQGMAENLTNWAGNHFYGAVRLHRPESLDALRALVARCRRLKALGTRHSFNALADTPEDLVSLERFDRVVALDRERRAVTVEAGVRYGALSEYLHREGFALHNLASLPHISVAGAGATATHGSGDNNGCLATAVSALEMVTADGEVISLSRERDPDAFPGAVVGLGALGIVTTMTLAIEPTYDVRQVVYEGLPFSQMEEHFDEIMAGAYSVSIFTDWRDEALGQVWRKHRVTPEVTDGPPEPVWFGARRVDVPRHPVAALAADNVTEQGGVPGPWYERLPHFRMEFTPSAGEELQSEYLVPREHAIAALRAVRGLTDHVSPLLWISELRTVAADDLWMSPFYRQAAVGIHFTWRKDWPAVSQVLPRIEETLAPFGARPHWGKLFTMPGERLRPLYPRLPDFQNLRRRYDPAGKFRNSFLDACLGTADPA